MSLENQLIHLLMGQNKEKEREGGREQALAGVAQWIERGLRTKGSLVDSQSGYMPGLQASSPVGDT